MILTNLDELRKQKIKNLHGLKTPHRSMMLLKTPYQSVHE